MSVRLFVGNLPYSATEQQVREHFSAVGPVMSVSLPMDRETGRPRGFAFVEFADRPLAEEAVRRFNNQPFAGRNLSVNEARPPERGAGGPPPRRDGGGGFGSRPPGGPPSGPRPGGYGGGPPSGPRPGGYGGGPPSGPRPGGYGGGPPSGPRPGGFGGGPPRRDDYSALPPPEEFADRERRRNFGPDAPARKAKKGGRGRGSDRERAPKGPLTVRSSGRFYGEDEEEGLEDINDINGDLLDMELDDDVDDEGDEGDEGDDAEGTDNEPADSEDKA